MADSRSDPRDLHAGGSADRQRLASLHVENGEFRGSFRFTNNGTVHRSDPVHFSAKTAEVVETRAELTIKWATRFRISRITFLCYTLRRKRHAVYFFLSYSFCALYIQSCRVCCATLLEFARAAEPQTRFDWYCLSCLSDDDEKIVYRYFCNHDDNKAKDDSIIILDGGRRVIIVLAVERWKNRRHGTVKARLTWRKCVRKCRNTEETARCESMTHRSKRGSEPGR